MMLLFRLIYSEGGHTVDNINSETALPSESLDSIQPLSEPLKVMVVEDESVVAQHICEELLKVGDVIVAVSGSGIEAIEFAKINRPHIVLIDIDLNADPINSVKTATRLQRLSKTPILIVFTITYPELNFPLARTVHNYAYLRKPFCSDDLKGVLQRAASLRDSVS
jgi:CheY-like chemotaxis protein